MDKLSSLIKKNQTFFEEVDPVFFNLSIASQKEIFYSILTKNKPKVFDEFESQLIDLIKNQNPSKKLSFDEINSLIERKYPNQELKNVGFWVYYPWNNMVVHILEEKDFIELRTVRNKYKITQEEQDILATKKIGVVGLSVGQSVSLALSMERCYGELRIADFDKLELSNYNRIRTPLSNLGLLKTISVKREIAEIDPYLKVIKFDTGLEDDKIEDFIKDLDIVVDEMDDIYLKIRLRIVARRLQIPVVSETSDRGLIDIERYDIEPKRPIYHGRLTDTDILELTPKNASNLLQKIVCIDSVSERMRKSFFEIGKTLTSWPQLGAEVAYGGAKCAIIIRSILLTKHTVSGRFYFDSK